MGTELWNRTGDVRKLKIHEIKMKNTPNFIWMVCWVFCLHGNKTRPTLCHFGNAEDFEGL